MEGYRQATSALEGRLFVLSGKAQRARDSPEDYFQSRPESQAVVVSWDSLLVGSNSAANSIKLSQPDGTSKTPVSSHSLQSSKQSRSLSLQRPPTLPETGSESQAGNDRFTLAVELAEPMLYLEGFDLRHSIAHRSTVLRGVVRLRVHESTTLQVLSLAFRGTSKTSWPEAWRLRRLKKSHEEVIINHSWNFLNGHSLSSTRDSAKTQTFKPGLYTANFELPLHSALPETIDLPLGAVSYSLVAIARQSDQSPPVRCHRDVSLVRIPCVCSLETVEPFGAQGARHGLRYGFMLHAKSVPISGQVGMSMRLASLQGCSWQRVSVSLTEDVQYRTRDGLAQREQSKTKAFLLEKRSASSPEHLPASALSRISSAGESMTTIYAGSASIEKTRRSSSSASSEVEISLLEKVLLTMPNCAVVRPDTAYSCLYVRHNLVITIHARMELNETTYRNFDVQITMPIQLLTCRLRNSNTTLPQYSENPPSHGHLASEHAPFCRCMSSTGADEGHQPLPEYEEGH